MSSDSVIQDSQPIKNESPETNDNEQQYDDYSDGADAPSGKGGIMDVLSAYMEEVPFAIFYASVIGIISSAITYFNLTKHHHKLFLYIGLMVISIILSYLVVLGNDM
tara:strand:+ start:6816 stop:7136 length:321 start_codon:yes stop_codon:yes gene_type:complete